MTRKKFVKKIMAHKIQRNKAVFIADLVRALGESYETVWKAVYFEAVDRAAKKMMEDAGYGQY